MVKLGFVVVSVMFLYHGKLDEILVSENYQSLSKPIKNTSSNLNYNHDLYFGPEGVVHVSTGQGNSETGTHNQP